VDSLAINILFLSFHPRTSVAKVFCAPAVALPVYRSMPGHDYVQWPSSNPLISSAAITIIQVSDKYKKIAQISQM